MAESSWLCSFYLWDYKRLSQRRIIHPHEPAKKAAISIPTNLAEGCGRKTDKDFAKYVQIAFGSAQEVEYLIFLSFELGYYSLDDYKILDGRINEIKSMLLRLLQKLRT